MVNQRLASALIVGLRGLSLTSRRNVCTSLSRGCLSPSSHNVTGPHPAAWHSHIHQPDNTSYTTEHSTKKIQELNFTADIWRVHFTNGNTAIQAPSSGDIRTIIGNIQDERIPIVLDPSLTADLIGDLVPDRISDIIGDDPESLNQQPEYKARHIQKIRRWRMNRHKLKRLRRRMKMAYRRRNYNQKKKKEARLKAVIHAIKQDGEEFDALEFVKERLERARRGGFVQDIWQSADEQPEVPWKDYTFPRRKIKTYEVKVTPPPFLTKKQTKERKKRNKYK